MHSLGYRNMTTDDVDKMIAEVDLNKNELVEFSEFLRVKIFTFQIFLNVIFINLDKFNNV